MSLKTGDKKRKGGGWTGSLAARMTLWYTLSSFALVLTASGFLYHALSDGLIHEDEVLLFQNIQTLKDILKESPGELEDLQQVVGNGKTPARAAWIWTRILDGSGGRVVETPGMSRILSPSLFPPELSADRSSAVSSPDGRLFRALSVQTLWPEHSPPEATIEMAVDRSSDEDILKKFREKLLVVLIFSLIACALAGYWIAYRGIRPVKEMAETAALIRSNTLYERLEISGLPSELSDLAETFNGMLYRLEDSFARLSRFSSDIAHELRTPLQNLRGEVEVVLRRERGPGEYQDLLGSCLEEYQRLSNMIDRLLFLARAEDPKTQIQMETIFLKKELELLRDFYELSAGEAGILLEMEAPSDLELSADRYMFQRAVGNLVENALNHTPSRGKVRLKAASNRTNILVEVSDTGRGIPKDQLPRVFDRFYRVDVSRSVSSGGAGLGLSIVKSIMDLHGGSVEIHSEISQGTSVILLFPPSKMTKS